jgi:hypothetical protein
MYQLLLRQRYFAVLAMTALIAGCAPLKTVPPVTQIPTCDVAAENDQAIGNWLSVRKQKGVAGELRTLFALQPDGTMAYTEHLKRGKHPSQGLEETGCWKREGQTLTLRTLQSNGSPVPLDDPIYTNRYTIVSVNAGTVSLRAADGGVINARRMSPGYRLPF